MEALEIHTKLGSARGVAVDWNNLGWASVYRGDLNQALERYRKGLEFRRKAGDRRGEGYALASLGWVEQMRGCFVESHRLLDQATRRLLRIGDRVLLGYTLVVRATALLDEGRLGEAAEIADKAVREWQRGGNRSGEAWTLTLRGEIAVERAELELAGQLLERSRQVWSSIGCLWGEAASEAALARTFAENERPPEARRALRSSLKLRRQVGDKRGLAECLEILAGFEAESRPELSRRLAATAADLRSSLDAPRPRRRLNASIPVADDAASGSLASPDLLNEAVSAALDALG
jgi:tetratricopeptide (TPR) repeat protein